MKSHALLLLALAASLMLGAASSANAQSSIQLAISPPSSSAAVGAAVSLDITVANVPATPGIGGYDVTLAFDPAVVRLDSLSDTRLLTSNIALCTPAQVDNAAGSATITCTPIPLFLTPGFSTTSPVAMIHASFTALSAGTSQLELTGSTLSDPSGNALAAMITGGSIAVSGVQPSATARTSATAAPTVTASTTPTATPVALAPSPAVRTPPAAATVAASVVKAPDTGTGGGSGGSAWPWVAGSASVVVLVALSFAAFLVARRGETRGGGS